MNRSTITIVGIGMMLAGIVLLFQAMRKPITIVVEDDPGIEKTTMAFTIGQALSEAQIALFEGDQVVPPVEHWLRPGETIRIQRAAWVYITADGKAVTFRSVERLPANLLAQAGVALYPTDLLLYDGLPIRPDQPLTFRDTHSLQVIRAQPLTVVMDGKARTFYTTAPTIGTALTEAGVRIRASDVLSLPLETPIEAPLRLEITTARPIEITRMGKSIRILSAAETVGDALAQAGVSLQGLDYSRPSPEAALPANGRIEVFSVQEDYVLETELIPYQTETQLVEDLEIDKTRIVQPGAFGMNVRRIRVRSINGEEVSREVEAEYTAVQPQNEIKGYGKKLVPHTMQTPDGTITYWRALNMYAVSYKPSSSGNYTSIGLPLRKGIVAVDTDYIAYGTRMYIPGYGFAIAGDTGGGVIGRLIDLGYSDEDYVSWHQWVTVYFLWPPPEIIAWIYP